LRGSFFLRAGKKSARYRNDFSIPGRKAKKVSQEETLGERGRRGEEF